MSRTVCHTTGSDLFPVQLHDGCHCWWTISFRGHIKPNSMFHFGLFVPFREHEMYCVLKSLELT